MHSMLNQQFGIFPILFHTGSPYYERNLQANLKENAAVKKRWRKEKKTEDE